MNFETSETKSYNCYYEMGKDVGRVQVWDAIKYASENPDVMDGKTIDEWLECGAVAFIEHVKHYQQDHFEIGEVVRIKDNGVLFVVTSYEPGVDILPGWVSGVNANGHIESEDVNHIERTGEMIEGVADILEALADYLTENE